MDLCLFLTSHNHSAFPEVVVAAFATDCAAFAIAVQALSAMSLCPIPHLDFGTGVTLMMLQIKADLHTRVKYRTVIQKLFS